MKSSYFFYMGMKQKYFNKVVKVPRPIQHWLLPIILKFTNVRFPWYVIMNTFLYTYWPFIYPFHRGVCLLFSPPCFLIRLIGFIVSEIYILYILDTRSLSDIFWTDIFYSPGDFCILVGVYFIETYLYILLFVHIWFCYFLNEMEIHH